MGDPLHPTLMDMYVCRYLGMDVCTKYVAQRSPDSTAAPRIQGPKDHPGQARSLITLTAVRCVRFKTGVSGVRM